MPNPKTITKKEKNDWYQKAKEYFGMIYQGPLFSVLLTPQGKRYKAHEVTFKENEIVVVKDQSFTVKYLSEHCMMLEPMELQIIKKEK